MTTAHLFARVQAGFSSSEEAPADSRRLTAVRWVFFVIAAFCIFRLLTLQIFNYTFYSDLASGSHEIYEQLLPDRGTVWMHDGERLFPLAISRDFYLLYADARALQEPQKTAERLAPVLSLSSEERFQLYLRLKDAVDRHDPYEPIAQKLTEEEKIKVEALSIEGLQFVRRPLRYYPEGALGSHIIGFYGSDEKGSFAGRYGIEAFFDSMLTGTPGFAKGEQDAFGAWIPLAHREIINAVNGADIVLTIDRTLEYTLCSLLESHAQEFKAASAAAVMLEPRTGRILALCSYPSFDPNQYGSVEHVEYYNNRTIFGAYEPGSVMKVITMAAGLDQEVVEPATTYTDEGFRKFGKFIIRNAADKVYGTQTMVQVLENSVNTGMIFVVERLGSAMFREYLSHFGFGKATGVELPGESAGDISSLDQPGDIYPATASFGQGITATPLQLAVAVGAIANKGALMRPRIIDEIKYPDGTVEKQKEEKILQVISPRTAALLTGMMVSVVQNGHGKPAGVKGYRIAGKTGTAQIAGPGGYGEETNQTFVGFAPADDPAYVLVVKYEKPERIYAEYTAAPTFGVFSRFALDYFRIPPQP